MATPVVVPALRNFDAELTSVAPKRTLPSWFRGDPAHQSRPSGHNPDDTPGSKAEDSDSDSTPDIRAGDYRLPLNAPFTAEQLIQYMVKECRAGRITWIKYIIFNKRIWSASSGWVTRVYTGSNPHDKHFHFSCKPDSASENNSKKAGLASLLKPKSEDDMPLNNTDALTVWKADIIPNPGFRPDSKDNKTTTANFAMGDVWYRVGKLQEQMDLLNARTLAAEKTLAQISQVLTDMQSRPAPGTPSLADLTEALRDVIREGTNPE